MSRYTSIVEITNSTFPATLPRPERLAHEAEKLHREFGWSVIPTNGKVAACKWKSLRDSRLSQRAVRQLFGCKHSGIGVICGSASDGLVVRDFDRLDAYLAWETKFPRLAVELPIAETARGMHVFFRSRHEVYQSYADGELRGTSGCYVIVPPSMHPDGIRYRWLTPPIPGRGGNLCTLDPAETGLDRCWSSNSTQQYHDVIGGATQENIHKEFSCVALPETVDHAIAATLPTGPGQRHHCLFALIRRLKALPGNSSRNPSEFRPVVMRWHEGAFPVIRTKSFETSWFEFVDGWVRCRTPYGTNRATDFALSKALANPCPIRMDYRCERMRLLAGVCWNLSNAGSKVFFLSTRDAARLLHIGGKSPQKTTWRMLRRLERDGVILCVERGTRGTPNGLATSYRFVAEV